MSEVKSAQELVDSTMENIYYPEGHPLVGTFMTARPSRVKMIEAIKADRRTIIKKCKDVIDNIYAFGDDGLQFQYESLNALDSVLSEIEKEE